MHKVKKKRFRDPFYTSYAVFKGRETGVYTEPRGAYNSIKDFKGAICYSFSSCHAAYFAFKYNYLKDGKRISEQDLLVEINRTPKRFLPDELY